MKNRILYLALFLVLLLTIWAIVFFLPDKSSTLSIKRYEIASMDIDTANMAEELRRLYQEFPLFLEGADLNDPKNQQQYADFVADERAKEMLNDILEKYPDLKKTEKQLSAAFRKYNVFFEREENFPKVYTYLSYLDYDNRVLFLDSALVIAIDMYLGPDYKHYDAIALPMYMRQRMDEPFIAVDVMKAVANVELSKTPQPQQNLLDFMILNGKVAYFLEKVLADSDAATRFGYTQEQMEWCKKSEKVIWAYLVSSQLLYEQDNFKYRNFIAESPTIQAFPGSPGRVGHFIGYQIVKEYMKNTNQTIPKLFAEQDAQKILKLSNYRP